MTLRLTGGMSARELGEEELIHGALRREQLWKMIGLGGAGFGVLGCLTAAAVALMVETPPPVVVPYDPETCLLYTSPSPRDRTRSRMPSSA